MHRLGGRAFDDGPPAWEDWGPSHRRSHRSRVARAPSRIDGGKHRPDGYTLHRRMDPVGFTSRLTAAARARESERRDRLFNDAFAAVLAGPEGFAFLDRHWMVLGETPRPNFEVRTRFFDDFLLEVTRIRTIRQVVLVAAGLDTRAFRLEWPSGVRLFELDQPDVLGYKAAILDRFGAKPRCERNTVAVDLRRNWSRDLLDTAFLAREPTAWLLEGLLMYLPGAAVERLLKETAELSVPQSELGVDTLALTLPQMQGFIDLYAERGCPVTFTPDDPVGLLGRCGWRAKAYRYDEEGARLGRPWPVAAPPPRSAM